MKTKGKAIFGALGPKGKKGFGPFGVQDLVLKLYG